MAQGRVSGAGNTLAHQRLAQTDKPAVVADIEQGAEVRLDKAHDRAIHGNHRNMPITLHREVRGRRPGCHHEDRPGAAATASGEGLPVIPIPLQLLLQRQLLIDSSHTLLPPESALRALVRPNPSPEKSAARGRTTPRGV